jgi:protein transport protein SEC61 subunit gamma-like protein
MTTSFSSFVTECRRVLTVTRKPTKDEYRTLIKVCGIGILVIGFIGFVIQAVKTILFG